MSSDPAATRTAQFIEIASEDDLIPWQFVHPDTKERWDSVLHIRIVPNDLQRRLKDRFTKPDFRRGQKYEDFNWPLFMDECLDYAIVRWEGVKRKGEDLPCEREWKLRLPELVKAELIRLCIGRELGEIQAGLIGHAADAGDGARPTPRSKPTSIGGTSTEAR